MQRQLNGLSIQGAAADGTGSADRVDWAIGRGWENYTAEEHAAGMLLFHRQPRLLPGRACDGFLDGLRKLPIGADQVPDFRRPRRIAKHILCGRANGVVRGEILKTD